LQCLRLISGLVHPRLAFVFPEMGTSHARDSEYRA
jgi:hypothetical protein